VTVLPTHDIIAGQGVAGAASGMSTTYTLNQGQYLQIEQEARLVGSTISSDKPTGVWGGSGCMDVPVGVGACDAAHQQIPSAQSLGSEYVAVRYRDRIAGQVESPPYAIVGIVDGTTLTYDPIAPTSAPSLLDRGQLAMFDASDAFVVRSQDSDHPFFLAGYMTGAGVLNDTIGDPEFVVVVPPAQQTTSYAFMTDPTYGNTNLVMTRTLTSGGMFEDVILDCVGIVGGWQPVGQQGKYEYARIDLVVDGQPQGACDNGAHSATSTAPFGLTVWGWDDSVSYAYAAGAGVRPINSVIVPAN
jgi:hypothetical protein